ncbi:MAG: YvcK family protein [Candidatus Niyogibacteria bacterium]|nr:YvcK family protein [Candidatus Niyogibacteria bacterium]
MKKDASKKKHVVVIGGGTGTYTVLAGLKKYPVMLSAIISMADDGGSTGLLREEFGMLPAGDVRRALVALSPQEDEFLAKLFTYRFREGGVNGHSFGNLILTALERTTGSFERAVEKASELLDIHDNQVIPVTFSDVRLFAELEDGTIIQGETNIDIPKHDGTLRINRVWLEPKARANIKAVRAIKRADLIVIGPGDLYTSIIPNLLVAGVHKALLETKARKLYVMNLMTKFGETHGFVAHDFLRTLEDYLEPGFFNAILVNTAKPQENVLKKYRKEQAYLIDNYFERMKPGYRRNFKIIHAPLLRPGGFVRHDTKKLAETIYKLTERVRW